ncbi:stress-induced-phosphoprotein 1-like isoform X2 [Zophobas morio]|uniref:stress-induced-phosphoprotein 1-like isoform X2 n=1 Tax=Zophobas morio TaxID=2755281 RepID=UPI0030834E13
MSVEELKAIGNSAFSAKDYAKAVDYFSKAIELAPDNHILYSNRSACYASLGSYDLALTDANKTIELKKDWSKGYSRKGAALAYLNKYDEAVEAYNEGLKYDPQSELLKKGLEDVRRQISDSNPFTQLGNLLNKPEVWLKISTAPSLAKYKSDPSFINKVRMIQSDPKLLSSYLSDPGIMALLSELMGFHMPTAEDEKENYEESNKDNEKKEPEKSEPEIVEDESEETRARKNALEEKEKGNKAYKKRDFEAAISHYQKATELDPNNCIYYSNLAAVYFEMKEYAKCREICEKAIEVGQDNYADFSVIAKLYLRMGNAYLKEDNLEEAVRMFNKSLLENRTKEALTKLRETENLLKERKEKEYIDPNISLEEKAKGNEFYANGKHPEAVKCYTEAIRRNPKDHVLYSNRAAALMALGEFPSALRDCAKCLELKPDFVKALIRQGRCYFTMKEYTLSFEAYEKALKVDKNNEDAIYGCQRALMMMQAQQQQQQQQAEGK